MSDHNQKAVTRRGFAATALVGGFALAAGPLNAAAIVTPADGLDAGEVSIPVKDGAIPAYRARPEGKRDCPVILVVQEIFGVHEHIKDVCRRFAKLGYYAIAPSLYARYGDPGKYGTGRIKDLVANIVSKVPDAEVMQDLDAAAAFAGGDGGDSKRLGITGWCWGGRIVWLYAAHARSLRAGVAWYGPLTGEK
ncbi:MAG: dienelactone hydrolase family protein, partial [Alphaproteobacteria bacterium]|nr:dienelactone hydrolase family protein [Alphaproteobacteria bacterium]